MHPFFSIIVVCLNPGNKLKDTLESIETQNFRDFEVIVKDGGSQDDSLEIALMLVEEVGNVTVIQKRDTGIYDAMNQAVKKAVGRYVYFLNCGDRFYSENVLGRMADFIKAEKNPDVPCIFYGNIFERLTGQQVISNPHIDAFGCYRNVPCHQACFYDRMILMAHPFDTSYQVRADYEQFLWCFFSNIYVSFHYTELLIVDYEGGGFSETRENRKLSGKEHREITRKYIPRGQLFKFKLIMWVTLAPLRRKLAENKMTAGIYNRFKKMLYLQK